MHIEHSPFVTEFASVRFGTSEDGTLRYETVGDYVESEWQTHSTAGGGTILLRGPFAPSLSDAATAVVRPVVERGIADGRI